MGRRETRANAAPRCAVPLVAALKRHSLEDGPGVRTVVFFKGCPLRCVFCHNPETQRPEAEVAFFEERCLRCGSCAAACPRGAAGLDLPGRIARARCDGCGRCAMACPGRGLRLVGTYLPPGELAERLLRDLAFYRHSGGGVTLSGGEPTLYPDYLASVLVPLREARVNVALQTCGYFDYDEFAEKLLPGIDAVYFDVKLADRAEHRRHTGVSNDRILANLARLVREGGVPVHPRVPIVPGVTDGAENLRSIVALLQDAGAREVALLPYNPLGLAMAPRLGRTTPPLPAGFMAPARERAVFEAFRRLAQGRGPESSTLEASGGP